MEPEPSPRPEPSSRDARGSPARPVLAAKPEALGSRAVAVVVLAAGLAAALAFKGFPPSPAPEAPTPTSAVIATVERGFSAADAPELVSLDLSKAIPSVPAASPLEPITRPPANDCRWGDAIPLAHNWPGADPTVTLRRKMTLRHHYGLGAQSRPDAFAPTFSPEPGSGDGPARSCAP